MESSPTLMVEGLFVNYGGIQALKDVSLKIHEGEIVALLGANGAGKTTLLRSISRLVDARSGKVFFEGKDISSVKPEKIVSFGIAHSPESRQVFRTMTVLENLYLGAYHHYRTSGRGKIREEITKNFELFPILKERQNQLAGTLSGGQQQMLAIARAMMSKPKLLLLDEPSLGLAPIIVNQVMELICRLREELGMTVLLVEQNAHAALKVSDRAYVLQRGEIIKHGSVQELSNDDEILNAYLGKKVSN